MLLSIILVCFCTHRTEFTDSGLALSVFILISLLVYFLSVSAGDLSVFDHTGTLSIIIYVAAKATYIRLLRGKMGILEGFFGPS